VNGRRSGFALLTVLWLIAAASAIALAGSLVARDGVGIASNRIRSERARWLAAGCLDRARAAADLALANAKREGTTLVMWRRLDRNVLESPLVTAQPCRIDVSAAGSRLDVNAADASLLARAFALMGLTNAQALANRVVDWRDADDVAEPDGAEVDWYVQRERHPPRNGPIADIHEVGRIAGFEQIAQLDSVLGIEPGRIALNSAPLTVLRAVPGFTDELVARLTTERAAGRDVVDVLAVAGGVSPAATDSVIAHYPEITRMTTSTPDAWTIATRSGRDPEAAVADARLVLGDGAAMMTRRSTWY